MRATSNTTSGSTLPFPVATPTATVPAQTSSQDKSETFAEVMQQHDDSGTADTRRESAPANIASGPLPVKISATTTTLNDPTQTAVPAIPAVAGKLVVTPADTASAASSLKTIPAEPDPTLASEAAVNATPLVALSPHGRSSRDTTAATAPARANRTDLPATSDLASMLVQAAALGANLPISLNAIHPILGDPGVIAAPDLQAGSAAPNATASVTVPATTLPSTVAAPLISAKDFSVASFARSSAPAVPKEKKSTSTSTEGSFLQVASTSRDAESTSSNLLMSAVTGIASTSERQGLAGHADATKSALNPHAEIALGSLGTSRDEKSATMTSALALPELTAPATASVLHAAPDVTILLNSNQDFEDAIRQVVHIAQLTEAASSRQPTRVAIELQTPPGAVVNVYVSRHDDTYRAQLSTNDPVALAWVQDKISALRQSDDLGVQVRWLPAQLEATTTAAAPATASGNNPNFNSQRDGQASQQQQHQPDERSQSQRQKRQGLLESLTDDTFFGSLQSLGRAA